MVSKHTEVRRIIFYPLLIFMEITQEHCIEEHNRSSACYTRSEWKEANADTLDEYSFMLRT